MVDENTKIIYTYDVTDFREQSCGIYETMIYLPKLITFLKECDILDQDLKYSVLQHSNNFFYKMKGDKYITQLIPYRIDFNDICFTKNHNNDMKIYYSPDDT